MLEWTKDLSTGSEQIDNQHKELFKRINALLSALDSGTADKELPGLIAFLEEYVVVHFTDEENLMLSLNYPGTRAHKAQHQLFIRRFTALKESIAQEGILESTIVTARDLLITWLKTHIMIIDKDLGSYNPHA